jgi:hypothetical protein
MAKTYKQLLLNKNTSTQSASCYDKHPIVEGNGSLSDCMQVKKGG